MSTTKRAHVDVARREINRQRLLELFKRKEPIWKDEDHSELKQGAAAWVRKIRAENEARFQFEKGRNRE